MGDLLLSALDVGLLVAAYWCQLVSSLPSFTSMLPPAKVAKPPAKEAAGETPPSNPLGGARPGASSAG